MKPLSEILHRSMLANSLLPLLIIDVALLLLYFGINQYSSAQALQLLLGQVLASIQQTNQCKAHTTTLTLNEVNHSTRIVYSEMSRFFETLEVRRFPSSRLIWTSLKRLMTLMAIT